MECCMAVWICSDLLKSKIFSAGRSQWYCRRSVVYAIRYPSDFRCVRVLNSALVGCTRCTLGFWFPKKYAHQDDPVNQGNLHELKLRLKIVRYPGFELGTSPFFPSACGSLLRKQRIGSWITRIVDWSKEWTWASLGTTRLKRKESRTTLNFAKLNSSCASCSRFGSLIS